MRPITPLIACLALAAPTLLITTDAAAQVRRSLDPRRATAEALLKPMTVNFTDAKLLDVMTFLQDFTGAQFDVMWIDDRNADGLDPDRTVSLSVTDMTALSVLERVLERTSEGFEPATWQFSEEGELQIGPKTRLNAYAELRLYDIRDLLFQVESFTDVPDLGLGQIIQGQGGGGGGGGFVVTPRDRGTPEEEAETIINLVIQFIEPDQWRANGGDGGSITYYQGNLLVRAPDYIQRQLGGYSFWPAETVSRGQRISERKRTNAIENTGGETTPVVADEKSSETKQN